MKKLVYQKNNNQWVLYSQNEETGKITILKKDKYYKDVNEYSKKYKDVNKYTKKESKGRFENIQNIVKTQNKIDKAIKAGDINKIEELEETANFYEYKKEEIKELLKLEEVKPSQKKSALIKYFYSFKSNMVFHIAQKNYITIQQILRRSTGQKVRVRFIDEDGNKFSGYIDRKDSLESYQLFSLNMEMILSNYVNEDVDETGGGNGKIEIY